MRSLADLSAAVKDASDLLPATPDKSPLAEVEYTENLERDSVAELDATALAFRERAKKEQARRLMAIDSEYWVCLCFHSREQKSEFLSKLNMQADSDKYVDGRRVATAVGIKLESPDPDFGKRNIDPTWERWIID